MIDLDINPKYDELKNLGQFCENVNSEICYDK